MAQTLVALLVHVVFSTKNRANLIAPEVETELYSYVGGILKERGSRLIAAGGTLKSRSFADLAVRERRVTCDDAGAQEKYFEMDQDAGWVLSRLSVAEGYGAFTIGASQIPVLRSYLARQKLHHQKRGFEDELLSLAERYGVDNDPKYLWG